ncbi:MAG TPA: universal stress protein [Vicinamibacterales bacterium]|nr:universal stress protein [Vicinamibacterales bacterium]
MSTFETILCAIDFSEHSRQALRVALFLADKTSSRIVAVHVVEHLLAEAAFAAGAADDMRANLSAELSTFIEAEGRPDRIAGTAIEIGEPHEAILSCAKARHAGLIVVGSRGEGGVRKALLGSVAERVLRQATVPVMAVPGDDGVPGFGGFSAVQAAVAFDGCTDLVLRHAAALASTLNLPLTLIHVVDPVSNFPQYTDASRAAEQARVDEAQNHLESLAAAMPLERVQTEVRVGQAAERIAESMSGEQVLTVLGTGGDRLLHRAGSTAYRVFSIAASPVLAIPPAATSA